MTRCTSEDIDSSKTPLELVSGVGKPGSRLPPKAAGLLFFLAIGCGLGSIYGYRLDYVSARGVRVAVGGQQIDRAAVAAEIEKTFAEWERVLGPVRGRVWLIFREFPFVEDGQKFAGRARESVAFVGWRSPVEATALRHELSHVILFLAGLDPSEESLRKISKERGIPY